MNFQCAGNTINLYQLPYEHNFPKDVVKMFGRLLYPPSHKVAALVDGFPGTYTNDYTNY
jgi:hypothetical protein